MVAKKKVAKKVVTKKKVTKKVVSKKASGKKKAVAVRKSADMTTINKEMQERMASISDQIGSGGPSKIKISRNKLFTLPTGETSDALSVVIVAWRTHNLYYDKPYSEGEINPPVCWAIGSNPDNMTPSDNSTDKQADQCNVNGKSICPMDVFKSKGKGKACQNRRVLAVLAPDATADTEILTLSVSPTGLRRFDSYVESAKASFKVLPIGLVTTITFDQNVDHTSLVFSNPVPNPQLREMWLRLDEAEALLEIEPSAGG